MSTTTPDPSLSWLNEQFLDTVLRNDNPGAKITITRFEIAKAGPKGGGYLSDLNRAVVQFRKNEGEPQLLSFIIKSPPVESNQFRFSVRVDAFLKEMALYEKALPSMRRLARMEAPRKLEIPFAPRSFPSGRPNTIVLEDMTARGYMVADRRRGLDYNHALLVVRSLADFHAMSILQYQKDPNSMSVFVERHYTQDNCSLAVSYFGMVFEAIVSTVGKSANLQRFVSKLDALSEKASDVMIEQVTPKEGGVSVLNHGDIWVNNLLFKYEAGSGKVEDVRFVDFQLSRFSSPALDLQFFFYLSLRDDVILHRLDELIEEYHKALANSLRDYGLDPDLITLEQLKMELREKESYALVTYCSKIWFVLINPDDVDGVVLPEDFQRGKTSFNCLIKVYSDPVIRQSFEKILPFFESRGVL